MNSICFVIPYFGRWPEWFGLYLASCARNPTIHWVFVTDCPPPPDAPPNVRFHAMTWPACAALVRETCGVARGPAVPHKLCDYKMAFGHVFGEYVAGFDFWGFGDVDVVYGDLRAFLTPDALAHDLLTFNRSHLSGHFTLVRNTPEFSTAYRHADAWRQAIDRPGTLLLDENIGYYGIENVYAIESYNTPFSPYIPWTDGEFVFPRTWYCLDGRLYNSLNGDRHFMYLHFMRYKYRWTENPAASVVHLPPASFGGDWTLRLDGFHPYARGERERERGAGICIAPALAASAALEPA